MNILDAPCAHCRHEVKTIRKQFGQDPIVILNAVADHMAGDWFITAKSVIHMDDANARALRQAGRDLYTEHACPGAAA